MATTWLQFLNKVLRPLGEDEIATGTSELTDDYHKLVSNFANQIKEEIEDAHNWRSLRTEYTVTVAINATETAITSPSAPGERCRVLREQDANNGLLLPLSFDTTDADNPYRLNELDISDLLGRKTLETDDSYDDINYFAVDNAADETVNLLTFPPCKEARTVKIQLINPQAWFDDDALSTNIKIPLRPLLVGTLWYCLEERGEELGINGIYTEQRYRDALDSAIARDMAEQGGLDLVPV